MEILLKRADRKLSMIIQHSSIGQAEIDRNGNIVHLNPKGEDLLKPIRIAHSISENNLYPILAFIAPSLSEMIRTSADEAGNIVTNELQSFSLPFGGENIERHFNFTVIKMFTDCIFVSFEDITQNNQKERAINNILSDKAIVEGKFEIASNILHDIGNAVVGFGAYITRIKRSLEQSSPDNLIKLADFFSSQHLAMSGAFGEAKGDAAIKMLCGITEAQKNNHNEINKSITEQLHIITHIQEILNIQRQYSNGAGPQEKIPVNLRGIINDCISMLLASIEKRGIQCLINVPDKMPAIQGDRTRLMQVILNILKNSIEAIDITAKEKKININATLEAGLLVLKVQDNGQGFDKATGSKIFERGFTTKAYGSGIGLGSCRSIVESHAGTINLTSDGFGQGALTTIQFKI